MVKIFISVLLLAGAVFAEPSEQELLQAQDFVQGALEAANVRGVNGVGQGACDPMTGGEAEQGVWETCIVIQVVDSKAQERVEKWFPPGARAMGVLVRTMIVGSAGIR